MTKIRNITVGDVLTISDMLSRVSKPLFDALSTTIVSGDYGDAVDDVDKVGAGMKVAQVVIDVCYRECRDGFVAWIADLINTDVPGLMSMDASTILDIIEQVVESKEVEDFFSRVSRLFSRIPRSGITSAGR